MQRKSMAFMAMGLGLMGSGWLPSVTAAPWMLQPATTDVSPDLKAVPKAVKGRSRAVSADLNLVQEETDTVALNLFDDTVLTVVRDRIEKIKGSRVWIGHIEGEPDSEVVLAIRGKAMMGTVKRGQAGGNQEYEIVYAGGNTHLVRQIDPSKVAPHADPVPAPAPEPQAGTAETTSTTWQVAANTTGTVIDVMVVYTPKAKTNAGGVDGIEAKIANAIARANQAYLNSQVNMQLNLVYTAEVSYTETGNMTDALYALQGTSDGKMDIVHSWRNQYGADLVALVSADSNYCGIGFVMQSVSTSFSPYAFAVSHDDSRYNCLGNTTLAHEFGHNQGNMHDPDNSSYPGAYPYSYGYRVCNVFRDVMSYNCSGEKQIQYFSNPNVYYNGYATGVANYQDTARSMNNTAPTVASFLQAQATTVPNAPSSLSASALSASSIKLSWTDNAADETGFKLERSLDGQVFSQIATLGQNATGFTDTGLAASTTYFYRVRAYNGVGDSAYSNTAQASTQAAVNDTTPPNVVISSPPNGAKVGTRVTINASASDNVGVASLKLYIDGKLVASTNSSSLSYTWSTRRASSGSHTIKADAADAAGNSASQAISVVK